MDESQLFTAFLFGLVGTAFFAYGKRSGRPMPVVSGLGLMILPGLLPLAWGLALAGALASLPWFLRHAA